MEKVASLSGRKTRSSYQQFDGGFDANSKGVVTLQNKSSATAAAGGGGGGGGVDRVGRVDPELEMQTMGRPRNVDEIVAETVVDVNMSKKTNEEMMEDRWL